MTSKLILVRHAKSSWKDSNLTDYERPLNRRGKHNAPLMGKRIKGYSLDIKEFISSPAERAKLTTQLIVKEISRKKETIKYEDSLYLGSINDFRNTLDKTTGDVILVLGHNPGIHSFCYWLCSEPKENFPTCGVALLEIPSHNWRNLQSNSGKLISFEYPKMFT